MISFERRLDKAVAFLGDNRRLVDCHLVDFISDDLWAKCLPQGLRDEVENVRPSKSGRRGGKQNFQELLAAADKLADFVELAKSLSLKESNFPTVLDDETAVTAEASRTNGVGKFADNFMSNKKQHEIKALVKLIGCLNEKYGTSLVIDAGAGKGYLSTGISERYSIPVLSIDSSKSRKNSAIRRQEIIWKKKRQETALIQYSIQRIDENTDYKRLIEDHFSDLKGEENCILTGLHACGQLAHSMIKSYLTTDCIKHLCLVSCCYHLSEELLTGKYNLTKNARMLAQQSVERTLLRGEESHPPSLFYRALLQVVLRSLGIPDARVGRGAPASEFHTYANWALKKIGVDRDKIPSTECLMQLYEDYSHVEWKFKVFQSIRVYLGSVVEAAIVLDRVVYLEKSGRCSKVALIQLFDPLISPRCYAIIASKR